VVKAGEWRSARAAWRTSCQIHTPA
jgi:hypothetical protein